MDGGTIRIAGQPRDLWLPSSDFALTLCRRNGLCAAEMSLCGRAWYCLAESCESSEILQTHNRRRRCGPTQHVRSTASVNRWVSHDGRHSTFLAARNV